MKVDPNVAVDGVMTDGLLDVENAVFNGASYDSDGIITGFTEYAEDKVVDTTRTAKLSGDYTIGLGDAAYTVADDAKLYKVDEDGNIAETALKNIRNDEDDTVLAVLDDGQMVSLFVQTKDAATEEGAEGPEAGDTFLPGEDGMSYTYTVAEGNSIPTPTALRNMLLAELDEAWDSARGDKVEVVTPGEEYTITIAGVHYTVTVDNTANAD